MRNKKIKRPVGKKILGLSLLAACLLTLGFGSWIFCTKIADVRNEHRQSAQTAANLTAQILQEQNGRELLQSRETGIQEKWKTVLNDIRRSFSLTYLYAYVPAQDADQIKMVFIAADEADVMGYGKGESPGDYEISPVEKDILQGRRTDGSVVYENQYGEVLSCFAPVYDAQGNICAMVGADTDMRQIRHQILRETLTMVIGMLLLISLLLLALYYGFQTVVLRHLQRIAGRMRSFVRQDAKAFDCTPLVVQSGDEFQDMAEAFNQMAKDIQQYMEHIAALTAREEKEKAEMAVARQIQLGMMPDSRNFLPEAVSFRLHAMTEPARQVGGDFFDFFQIDEQHICVAIGDVSGKGVPSALFMVNTKTLIKNYAMQKLCPSEILQKTNLDLLETNPYDLFVTVFVGILDLSNGLLCFANGGHNPPYIKREGYQPMEVSATMMLGAFDDAVYLDESVQLHPGDAVFLYTDGVTEAVNPENEFFGEAKLVTALHQAGERSPVEFLQFLQQRLTIYAAGQSAWDDITMLQLVYLGGTKSAMR